MEDDTKQCPFCAETIKKAAIVCRYCGRDLVDSPRITTAPSFERAQQTRTGLSALLVLLAVVGGLALVALGVRLLGQSAVPAAPGNVQNSSRSVGASYSAPVASGPTRQFTGRGKDITSDWISQGFIIVKMSHSGQSNFAVLLKDSSSGDSRELLANEIGAYSGTRAALEPPGKYFLDVEADGSWALTVMEPGHLPHKEQGPYQFQGRGPDVAAVFRLDSGRVDISLAHQGTSNFAVVLYDVTRDARVDLLANEIGTWQGRTVSNVGGGWYLLDVEADGAWTIRVTQ